jgi:hypothetical protein
MALTVPGPAFAPGFDATLIDATDWDLFNAAQSGNEQAVAMFRGPLRGVPQFKCVAKTTDNTAASSAMDLTTLGLTFPAKSFRRLTLRSTAVSGADTWTQTWEQDVWGNDGTTPKLHGSPRLIAATGNIAGTAVSYGLVRASATFSTGTATNTARASAGVTIGNTTTGVATITHPIARAGTKVVSVTAYTDDQTNTTHRQAAIEPGVTSTTALLSLLAEGLTSNTGVVGDFAAVGAVDALLEILPPPSAAFVMSTNNVQVHCGYDATDNVYHRVEVWATRADIHALAID